MKNKRGRIIFFSLAIVFISAIIQNEYMGNDSANHAEYKEKSDEEIIAEYMIAFFHSELEKRNDFKEELNIKGRNTGQLKELFSEFCFEGKYGRLKFYNDKGEGISCYVTDGRMTGAFNPPVHYLTEGYDIKIFFVPKVGVKIRYDFTAGQPEYIRVENAYVR